jgi:hypothetical protein
MQGGTWVGVSGWVAHELVRQMAVQGASAAEHYGQPSFTALSS